MSKIIIILAFLWLLKFYADNINGKVKYKETINRVLCHAIFNIVLLIVISTLIYFYLSWINYAWQDYSTYSTGERVVLSWFLFVFSLPCAVFGNMFLYNYFINKQNKSKK